ncbi:DUF1659 domain-containing protein [Anaerospora hongkongensis]|uniref:DUF1659 domain-containing protein n=1 Tax=Anaerospora hongkongensis TaxID=244830 RepID=UPI002FD90FFD
MAVVRNLDLSTLTLKVQAGISATGAALFKNVNFGGVKAAAVDQDVYDVANAVSGLQSRLLEAILRTDHSELASI